MASFSSELERACAKQAKELGRDLTSEELEQIEGLLFESWIDAGRLDELIRVIFARFGRDGGLTEIATLGHHLRETKDVERIHALFGGLLSCRVKAFHEWWPRAREGHIGCMQSAARASSEAFDIYVEYFYSLSTLSLVNECEALRNEMLRFQNRDSPKHILPPLRSATPKSGV